MPQHAGNTIGPAGHSFRAQNCPHRSRGIFNKRARTYKGRNQFAYNSRSERNFLKSLRDPEPCQRKFSTTETSETPAWNEAARVRRGGTFFFGLIPLPSQEKANTNRSPATKEFASGTSEPSLTPMHAMGQGSA